MDIKEKFQKLKDYYINLPGYNFKPINDNLFQVLTAPKGINPLVVLILLFIFILPAFLYVVTKMAQKPQLYRTYELRQDRIYSNGQDITRGDFLNGIIKE